MVFSTWKEWYFWKVELAHVRALFVELLMEIEEIFIWRGFFLCSNE